MTIQSVRVANKSIMIVERFAEWLKDHAAYTVGELNLAHSGIAKVFVGNNTEALFMKVRGNDRDQMALTKYSGVMSSWYCVRYLECMTDDDGEEYFSSICSEDFGIDDLHNAIEAFVLRWESEKPWLPSMAHKPIEARMRIIGHLFGKIRAPERVAMPYIDNTFTPEQIKRRVGILTHSYSMGGKVSRETILATKHLMGIPTHMYGAATPKLVFPCHDEEVKNVQFEGRLNRPDTDNAKLAIKGSLADVDLCPEGMTTIFKDGVITEAAGVVVFEDSDKVGYTGNKCSHGTGSMDHIGW